MADYNPQRGLPLSPNMLNLVKLLANGMNRKQMAVIENRSLKGIYESLAAAKARLGLQSDAAIIRWAIDNAGAPPVHTTPVRLVAQIEALLLALKKQL